MSLLIKALEQAAKDRKTSRVEPPGPSDSGHASAEPTIEPPPPPRVRAATPRQDEAPPAGPVTALPGASTPQAPKATAASATAPLGFERPLARKPASGTLADLARIDAQQQRARAASVLQAAGGSAATAVAFLRANPVIAFGAAAVVLGIGFGVYVYLQLAHPGLFVASPSRTAAPAAPPPAPAQPGASPAAVAPAASTPSAPAAPSTATGPAPASTNSTAPTAGAIAAPAADSARPPGNTPGPVPAAAVIAAPKATDAPAIEPQRVTAEAARDRAGSKPESAPASKPSPAKAAPPAAAEAAAQTRERIEVSATNAQPRLNPMLAQAYSLMQASKIDDARALYTKVAQAEPLSIDALLGLAYIAGRENRTDEATQLYVRILQLNPRHALAQANLIALMGRADPGASETRLKQLIAREPSAFLHFVLGNVYAEQSQWSQAQQSYFQAHHLEPGNPDYAYNLAVGLDHLRQAKLALNYYRRAAELAGTQGRGNFSLDHVRERISALAAQLE